MPRRQSKSSPNVFPHTNPLRPISHTGPIMPRPIQAPTIPTIHQQPSFGQIIKDGFAFGIGSSIAHRIFGPTNHVAPSVNQSVNPSTIETIPKGTLSKELDKNTEQLMYNQCILEGGNQESCKEYLI